MATAGYSGTPLIKKLGIRDDLKILLVNQPENYFKLLEVNVSDQSVKPKEIPDLIHLFVKNNKEFEAEMKKLKSLIKANPDIVIWVSWYKKTAGMNTDLTEDVIRNYALKE